MTDYLGRLKNLDTYIQSEMQKWHVPGAAVAVIHGDTIIHQKGYGTRDIEKDDRVTPETLFAIGSCTKAFTTMALAQLVDDGKLDWDTPIRRYMPSFKLHDSVASDQMTARDLVSHRSGLPRHDMMWYGSSRSRWELFERLQYLVPSQPFRYVFQYQNLMYMVAGCLIESVTGQTWESFVQQRIFDPLGMKESVFSVITAEQSDNAAKPHEIEDEAAKRIPFRNIDAIGPAGSIHSNLPELATWLMMHMNGGQHNGQQFVSPENLKQMHQPWVVIPPVPQFDFVEIQHNAYGLGWAQHIYRGRMRIRHTGGIDGFITDVSFMPNENLGVIVYNNGGDSLSMSIAMHVYDCLLDQEPIDWRGRYKQVHDQAKAQVEEQTQKLKESQHPDTSLSHPLEAYTGTYEHPGYGLLSITRGDGKLRAEYNNLKFEMEHLHFDIFETKHELGETTPPMPIAFTTGVDGAITQLTMQFEPAVDAIAFTRVQAQPEQAAE